MRITLLSISLLFFVLVASAGRISGVITDDKGTVLPYASVTVKGTTRGTTANSSGQYSIQLNPGEYILVAQYVGYARHEKPVSVTGSDMIIDFELVLQELTLGEVIVKKAKTRHTRSSGTLSGNVNSITTRWTRFQSMYTSKGYCAPAPCRNESLVKRSNGSRVMDSILWGKEFCFSLNP